MINPELDAVERAAREQRQITKSHIVTTFEREHGGEIVALGSSMSEDTADFFSDVDTWVFLDDKKIDSVLETRDDLYASIGSPLLTWERPRFAPVGGVHSIVLYDGPGLAPAEVDYYLAPSSKLDYYNRFIKNPEIPSSEFEWKTEPDDASVGAQMDHLALVAMWATKYWYRRINRDEQFSWMMRRYEGARDTIGLPALHLRDEALGTTAVFSTVIDNLYDRAEIMDDVRRMRVCEKLAQTVDFVDQLEETHRDSLQTA